ncbi:MAG: inorganic phosphate transporter [Propionibacteriaceae bacterium]|nr:inorganic phosphate transporter [Propionibacteriaceae bacterium]
MSIELMVLIVVITALVFDFTNGFHDSANAMATSVATGAFKPRVAVLLAAVMNLLGALMSTEVAKTISSGIVDDSLVTPQTVFAALVGAIIWNLVTWLFGLPSSSSHAIFGALIGAVLVQAGMAGVHMSTIVSKILLPALVAPFVAGLASYLATKISYHGAHNAPKGAKKRYRMAQRVSSLLVALAHGTSDGQKTMGIITLVLVAGTLELQQLNPAAAPWWGQAPGTAPHWWVIFAAGLAIALGTYSGGWRIMRTMGKGMADIESPQGFAAETSAMAAILASSHLGFGLSTTHVVSGAVMGTGLARTPDEVRWSTAGRMVTAWLLTLPAAGLVGALAAWLAHQGTWGFIAVLIVLVACASVIKIIGSYNHVSHENVTDSHEVKILTKATLSAPARPVVNPLQPALPGKIADHPMATTPLRLTKLKKPKNKQLRKPPEAPSKKGSINV